ncbi:hypothetical protein CRYUN_Cryun37aG0127200 [Craigia yunnanensis]
MDKGWGLTLDSDPVSNFFPNKTNSTTGPFFRLKQRDIFQFPVSLAGSRDDSHGTFSSSSPSDENRLAVDEVDFFSDKKHRVVDDREDNKSTAVQKVTSHGEGGQGSDLDVNTGLHLLTANVGSKVDDGVSSDMEDKLTKNELAQLQAELKRITGENQKLRDMISHVSNNYSALQMHLMTLMQQQKNPEAESNQEAEIQERKTEVKKDEVIVSRKFMDPGRSGIAQTDGMSHSSSEERTRSGSPPNNVEVASKDYIKSKNEIFQFDQETSSFRDGKRIGREESPEWGPNKAQKLNPEKPIDQSTEATMRKARVSVRARSEAPMGPKLI